MVEEYERTTKGENDAGMTKGENDAGMQRRKSSGFQQDKGEERNNTLSSPFSSFIAS